MPATEAEATLPVEFRPVTPNDPSDHAGDGSRARIRAAREPTYEVASKKLQPVVAIGVLRLRASTVPRRLRRQDLLAALAVPTRPAVWRIMRILVIATQPNWYFNIWIFRDTALQLYREINTENRRSKQRYA